ncbi:MAG: cytidylate kinase family protein [Candidatus Paceibacterota bacterium]
MKKEILTIAGDPGSGKSTTADIVAHLLKYRRFSSGSLMREMAEKQGVTIGEMNHLAETDPNIDREIDTAIQDVGALQNKLVIDSRTAWHWIPDSFKVYLTLNPEYAAQRIFNSLQTTTSIRTKTEHGTSVEDVLENTLTRAESERKRFIERYEINSSDTSQFDVVIETETNSPEQVAEKVIESYNKWRLE